MLNKNPCKECIVTSMCQYPCDYYILYIRDALFDFVDIEDRYPTTPSILYICRWLRINLTGILTEAEIGIGPNGNKKTGYCMKVNGLKKKATVNKFYRLSGDVYETQSL